jgi:hypothetical protein
LRTIFQRASKLGDILSVQAYVNKAAEIGNKLSANGGGQYLNAVGLQFQYIDQAAVEKMGVSQNAGLLAPYGNILEDIGYALSTSADKRAKAIASAAVKKYIDAINNGSTGYYHVHMPLVVGALMGGAGRNYRDFSKAVNNFNKLSWWDLNEGTQRRIHNNMADLASKYNVQNLWRYKGIDGNKLAQAQRLENASLEGMWGDALAAAIFAGLVIIDLPATVRSINGLAKQIKGVTSKPVSASRQFVTSSKASAASKVKAAPKTSTMQIQKPAITENSVLPSVRENYTSSIGSGSGAGGLRASSANNMKEYESAKAAVRTAKEDAVAHTKDLEFKTEYHAYWNKNNSATAGGNIKRELSLKQKTDLFVFGKVTPAAQAALQLLKSPKNAALAAVLPMGTTVSGTAPAAVVSSIIPSAKAASVFYVPLADVSYSFKSAMKANNLLSAANPFSAAKTFGGGLSASSKLSGTPKTLLFLPQITGVQNKFHGGSSFGYKAYTNHGAGIAQNASAYKP